jgi:zinc protease
VLARDRLPVAFELEADRMASLRLPADEFSREIEVIKEERRLRTDDQPMSKAFELFRHGLPGQRLPHPTIGWMADLERMKVEELRHWYESWYAPNNATLVVVGDVTPTKSKPWPRNTSAPSPSAPCPASCRWSWPSPASAS